MSKVMKTVPVLLSSLLFVIAVSCGNTANEQLSNEDSSKVVSETGTGDRDFDAYLNELDSMGEQQDPTNLSYINITPEQIHALFEESENQQEE